MPCYSNKQDLFCKIQICKLHKKHPTSEKIKLDITRNKVKLKDKQKEGGGIGGRGINFPPGSFDESISSLFPWNSHNNPIMKMKRK